jgi:hypothetical protein
MYSAQQEESKCPKINNSKDLLITHRTTKNLSMEVINFEIYVSLKLFNFSEFISGKNRSFSNYFRKIEITWSN